jgi:hypothetical protein
MINKDGRMNGRSAISPPLTLDNAMNFYFPSSVQYILIYKNMYIIIITFKVFPIAYSEVSRFLHKMKDKNKL